jgi:hypothetical protein
MPSNRRSLTPVNPYAPPAAPRPPNPGGTKPGTSERRLRWILMGCGCCALVGLPLLFILFLAVWQYLAPTERVVPPAATSRAI